MDFFCVGGGAGTGLETGLGRGVTVAKNHSPGAISMHTATQFDMFVEHDESIACFCGD